MRINGKRTYVIYAREGQCSDGAPLDITALGLVRARGPADALRKAPKTFRTIRSLMPGDIRAALPHKAPLDTYWVACEIESDGVECQTPDEARAHWSWPQ